jgi:hypothetical protein
VHVRVVAVTIELFGLAAYVKRLFVNHMHVKQEGQIVVGEGVRIINEDASFEMLDSLRVVANLEVGETKVVVQLGIL